MRFICYSILGLLLKCSPAFATPLIDQEFLLFLKGADKIKSRCEEFKVYDDRVFYNSDNRRNMSAIFAANMQNLGLEIATTALAYHAFQLKKTKEDFFRDMNRIISSSCSNNMTIKSKKSIKEFAQNQFEKIQKGKLLYSIELLAKFRESNDFKSYHENSYFLSYLNLRDMCSWAGNGSDLRMMTNYLKEPLIAQLLIELVTGEKSVPKVSKPWLKTQQYHASCNGFFCRNKPFSEFKLDFPSSLGGSGMGDSMSQHYCLDLRWQEFDFKHPNKIIRGWLKEYSPTMDSIKKMNLISHLFMRPEFMLAKKKMTQTRKHLTSILTDFYQTKAKQELNRIKKNLYHEDYLSLRVLDGPDPQHPLTFKVEVSFGEWDRAISEEQKLMAFLDLKFSKAFIRYTKNKMISLAEAGDNYKKKLFKDEIHLRIKEHIAALEDGFWQKPWNDNLHQLIAPLFLEKVAQLPNAWIEQQTESISAPLEFHYGPFALKFISNRFNQSLLSKLDT